MKRFFVMLSLALVTMAAMAVPVKPGWKTIRLADGSEVRVQPWGDEHGHWLQAADGTCYVAKDGMFVAIEKEALLAKREARQGRRGKNKAIYASTSDGLGEYGKMSMGRVPSIGEYTIPVVMVQFSNLSFKSTTTVEKMTRYYNEEGYQDEPNTAGSVRDYFKEQSGGQFIPTFDVVGIVTLSHTYEYYGKNDSQGNDMRLDELPGDVIAAAISQLGTDFSQYVVPAADGNHKDGVPLMAMLYAGKGEATEYPSGSNYLWPCEWDDDEDNIGNGDYEGVHFNSFFIGNELGSGGGGLMGCAVFCHEFGHALGLPDFYGNFDGDDSFGNWSIMDTGAYLDDDCRIPAAYTAYEKSYMGWLNLPELDYTQDEVELCYPGDCAEGSAVIVRHSNTETFILENHQPSTFFPVQYGSGVLVMRIAYKKSSWEYNSPNTSATQKRACVLTANGAKMNYSADKNHLYGYSKTSIGELKTYDGQKKNIAVKKVTKNNDNGTIMLTLNESGGGGGVDPQPVDDALFYESFDQCDGTGGNDDQWSGQIASATFQPDNDGWVVAGDKAYGANQCAKFGTSSIVGSATTPAFTLNGTTTMTFKAGAWKSNNDGTTLLLSAEGGTVEPASVTMEKGSWTDYTVSVTGTGTVTITFEAEKGRFFLDEVFVKTPTTTGITVVEGSPLNSNVWYTLDGRMLPGEPTQKGVYIYKGKKVKK